MWPFGKQLGEPRLQVGDLDITRLHDVVQVLGVPSGVVDLAFAGLGAEEAHSEANMDNAGSNGVSERLGYERNGTAWATCDGQPVLGQRWRLERAAWEARRRGDVSMSGVDECRAVLGIRR